MQRRYEFMDLIVTIGLCATIIGGGLLFMVANGTWQVRTVGSESIGQPTGGLTGMYWLQPVLGQAIVDYSLLERNHAKAASAAITQMDGLTLERNRWQNSPFGYLDSITTGAAWAEAEHAARVQAVMGRSIVNFTRRGVRSGAWSSVERAAHYNPHMIGVTEAMGQKMDAAFLASWQPNLGRAIVDASQERATVSARTQEQTGAAIVQLTAIQTTYEGARAAIQEQLAGAIVAAVRTEWQANLADQTAAAQPSAQQPVIQAAERRAWPEIPSGYLVVASIALVGLFMAGLLLLPTLPVRRVVEVVTLDAAKPV